MLVVRRLQLTRLVFLVALWGGMAALVTSPCVIRNWVVVGSPLFLKSNLGMELFIGNNSEL